VVFYLTFQFNISEITVFVFLKEVFTLSVPWLAHCLYHFLSIFKLFYDKCLHSFRITLESLPDLRSWIIIDYKYKWRKCIRLVPVPMKIYNIQKSLLTHTFK
jgi:hypothetical protein